MRSFKLMWPEGTAEDLVRIMELKASARPVLLPATAPRSHSRMHFAAAQGMKKKDQRDKLLQFGGAAAVASADTGMSLDAAQARTLESASSFAKIFKLKSSRNP